jgi:hypothetical protein
MKNASLSSLQSKLGKFLKVSNFEGYNGSVRNQFVLQYSNGEIFQSYQTVCGVKLNDGSLYLSGAHDYSQTTNKYVGQWCGKGVAERRRGITEGSIGFIKD